MLGPSGSGKSTLSTALNGLIPHHVPGELSGSVHIDGHDTRTLARLGWRSWWAASFRIPKRSSVC